MSFFQGSILRGKGKKRIVFLSIPQRPPFLEFCVFWFLPQRPVPSLAHRLYLLALGSVNECKREKGAPEMESQGPGLSSHATWPHRRWLDPMFQTRALHNTAEPAGLFPCCSPRIHLRPTQASLAQILTQPVCPSSSYSHFPCPRPPTTHSNTLLGKKYTVSCVFMSPNT